MICTLPSVAHTSCFPAKAKSPAPSSTSNQPGPQGEGPADKAELSSVSATAPVSKKCSTGMLSGLKRTAQKTALIAALGAAALGSMATPALADGCWGQRPGVSITLGTSNYNPYTGATESVGISIGRGGVRLQATQTYAPPPVVVMPAPGQVYYPPTVMPAPAYVPPPVVLTPPVVVVAPPVYVRPAPVYVQPHYVQPHYHHHGGWR